jgi:hypothetical protein
VGVSDDPSRGNIIPFLGVGSGKTSGARLHPISFEAIAPKKSAIMKILSKLTYMAIITELMAKSNKLTKKMHAVRAFLDVFIRECRYENL